MKKIVTTPKATAIVLVDRYQAEGMGYADALTKAFEVASQIHNNVPTSEYWEEVFNILFDEMEKLS